MEGSLCGCWQPFILTFYSLLLGDVYTVMAEATNGPQRLEYYHSPFMYVTRLGFRRPGQIITIETSYYYQTNKRIATLNPSFLCGTAAPFLLTPSTYLAVVAPAETRYYIFQQRITARICQIAKKSVYGEMGW